MIRQLPAGYALVIRGGMSPVIARLPMCWKDPTYKAARRAGRAVARLDPIREVSAVPPARPEFTPLASPEEDPEPADVIPFPASLHEAGRRYPWDE